MRMEELTALCPSQQTLDPSTVLRKRKRASGISQVDRDASEIGSETDNSDHGEAEVNDDEDETALISTLVHLKADNVRAAWNGEDIERLLAAVDQENFSLPKEKLKELSQKVNQMPHKYARS